MASGPNRLHKWLIGGPPLAYLLFFFAIPVLIMVVASLRNPGTFGGLAPIFLDVEGGRQLNLTGRVTRGFFPTFFMSDCSSSLLRMRRLPRWPA